MYLFFIEKISVFILHYLVVWRARAFIWPKLKRRSGKTWDQGQHGTDFQSCGKKAGVDKFGDYMGQGETL